MTPVRKLSGVVFDLEWETTLARRVGAMVLQGFLYGFFSSILLSALFLLCMNKRAVPWPFTLVMMAMYAISSADVSLSAFYLFRYVLDGRQTPTLQPRPSVLFFITNYALANTVLIYRCYVVWSRKRCILVLASTPLLGITIAGYILENSPRLNHRVFIYLWATFGFSTCLALCTGARILLSARRASNAYRTELPRKLYSISSVIVDSGVIYSVYLVLVLNIKPTALRAGLSQIVGIVPTLVIVRTSLSRYLHDFEDTASMRSAPDSRTASTPVLDSIFSMAGNTTVPSLIATTAPHASAHVTADAVRDAPDGLPVVIRPRDRSSA